MDTTAAALIALVMGILGFGIYMTICIILGGLMDDRDGQDNDNNLD